MEWIAIEDGLPEQFSFVLATIKVENEKWVEIVGYGYKSFFLPGRGESTRITHWMPLPKPCELP